MVACVGEWLMVYMATQRDSSRDLHCLVAEATLRHSSRALSYLVAMVTDGRDVLVVYYVVYYGRWMDRYGSRYSHAGPVFCGRSDFWAIQS